MYPKIKAPVVIAWTSYYAREKQSDYQPRVDSLLNAKLKVHDTGHFAPMSPPDLVIALIKKYAK